MQREIRSEAEMEALGLELLTTLVKPAVVFLTGDLGAGKTVLARAMITALGHTGAVKSPTYTLLENYELDGWRVSHLDLYRLDDPEELHYIGFRDIVANSDLVIIEWPEKGHGQLPKPSLEITITYSESNPGSYRSVSINTPSS